MEGRFWRLDERWCTGICWISWKWKEGRRIKEGKEIIREGNDYTEEGRKGKEAIREGG